MGRPLNKKYFGNRNLGSTSTSADNGIGGQGLASVTVNTAGSYTSAPTFTFPAPALAAEGAVTATGAPTFEVLSVTIGGTQTRAYPVAAGAINFAGGTTTATFTATVTSSALTTVVRASATTLGFDTTTTAMISGTSIHITGASITGTMTIGGVAIAAGQIYYVGAPTDAVSATLFSNYADAVAATNPLTIVAGTGTTGATFTRGVTYGTVTALAPATRGAFSTLVTGAQAAVTTDAFSSGAGLTITPTYRLLGVNVTEKGSGYLPAVAGTATITATTAAAGANTVTGITSTISGNVLTVTALTGVLKQNMILTGGSVTAGAYIVNQLTGTTGDVGTYTVEVYGGGAVTGTPTGATLNAITVSSTSGMMPGMTFTPATTVGGLTGSTVYYIINCLGPTTVQVGTTLGATSAVATTTTVSQSVSAPFGQFLGVTVSAGSGAVTMVLTTASYNIGSNSSSIQITAFLPVANGGKATRQNSDIVAQKGTHRFRVENQDGTGVVTLTAGTVTAGLAVITATDSSGNTYYVTKITSRKALLTRKAGSSYEFVSGTMVRWTVSSPVLNTSVKIDNQ